MPVELQNSNGAHLTNGPFLDRPTIKGMVLKYRDNHKQDPNCLNFIHFSLNEVIQLFIDNNMIDPNVPVSGQLFGLQYLGLKVYLGTHVDKDDCPPSTIDPNPYITMDTAILCCTKLDVTKKMWRDQLVISLPKPDKLKGKSETNFVSLTALGEGLDKGSICPPDCPPKQDAYGFFHEDVGK